ncbi:hypothetical protein ACAW74_19915 [Fibrella sp. WM1]|uniref:hypothetical protein n=1 Tax=Fibrella musci TaxID=3242485 RepID=UPI0035208FD6
MASPAMAQIDNGNLPTDPIRVGILIEPHQPETPYQVHARLIQEELITVGKALNQLSTVDPPTYSTLQESLLTYLYQLRAIGADYGEPAVYESAMLFLQRIQEQTKRSLIDWRRSNVPSPEPPIWAGAGYVTQAHTPLFRRPDFHSRRLHLLPGGEPVTLLQTVPGYYLVQSRLGQGYVPRRMLQPAEPVSVSAAP